VNNLTLAQFIAEQADRADASAYPGTIFLSVPQVRLLYALARKEGAVHPADNESVVVDGFQFYLRPTLLKGGARYRMPYSRGKTEAERKRDDEALVRRLARENARAAAVRKFHATGDTSALEQFVNDYPDEAVTAGAR
jgi:hypothetical protein